MIEVVQMRTHVARLFKTVALGCAIYAVGGFVLVLVAAEGEI